MLDQPLVNRVANSSLVTIDLEDFFPAGEIVPFDLKAYLFMELILKEKDFREALNAINWEQYKGKNLAVFCSTDAIIPMWAYMLVATHAAPYVEDIALCEPANFVDQVYLKKLASLDLEAYEGKRLVVKGCSDKPVPPSAYLEITRRLQPIALSIMFGEPCSTVPVFKKK
ncbi:MAG TPA: hypothetical protein DCF33_00565 [Saprospirales bacterium]|nr:hypothetical protein [Saprospirales bacterium]